MLGGAELVEVSSDGEPGDKARFVRGVERALLAGEAEIGVHSAKDLPAEMTEGLTIAGVPAREDVADAWIGVGDSLEEVPEGARVGTASLRRGAQLLAARPDLRVEELHGNVDTRLRKLGEGELDAIVLAVAGLRRLGREGEIAFAIPAETMTSAAGQGALVLQTRAGDEASTGAAAAIGDATALGELSAERAAVALLEADCTTPIGVRATAPPGTSASGGQMRIEAFVGLPDGSEWIRDRLDGDAAEPETLGRTLAERLLGAGAREILDRAGAMA
jgi:hydroxymethylbilane synthase